MKKVKATAKQELILLALYENPQLWMTSSVMSDIIFGEGCGSSKTNIGIGTNCSRLRKIDFVEGVTNKGNPYMEYKITPDGQDYVRKYLAGETVLKKRPDVDRRVKVEVPELSVMDMILNLSDEYRGGRMSELEACMQIFVILKDARIVLKEA